MHVDDNAGTLSVDDGGGSLTIDGTLTAITNVVHVDDNAGTLSVDDGGGALTVDNAGTFAVQAAQSGNWPVRIQDGSGNAVTSAARGSERAVSVQIVDGSGAQITAFGGSGGTASNFGSADPATGTAVGFSDGSNMREARVFDADSGAGAQYVLGAILRRAASGGSVEAGTSSDPLRVDPTGTTAQPVSDGGGSLTVDGTVAATQSGNWSTRLLDGSGNAITSAVRGSERAATVQIVDASGAQVTSFGGSPAAGATSIAKAEDVASADADVGVPAMAVRKATPANTSGTDGDYEFLQISAGRLWASAVIDSALPAGSNAIGKLAANSGVNIGDVGFASQGFHAAVAKTRPNDTAAYAANDVIGTATGSTAAWQFASMGPSGGLIRLTGATLRIDAAAIISGETSYLLHLYNVTPPSATGDNGAFNGLASGDRASYLGFINLGAPAALGSTLWIETGGILKPIQLAGTDLFGYLVTVGAHTPTAQRVYNIELFSEKV